jgi:CIC family chloride channel protein
MADPLGRSGRETHVLFTLTVVVGCLSGLAAVSFHRSIDGISSVLLDPLLAASLTRRLILLPLLLIGVGLIVGILLDKIVPFTRGSGIPEVKTAYTFGPRQQLSLRTVVGKFVLGALSIGSGFSLGREGRPSRSARRSARPSGRRHVVRRASSRR